MSQTPTPKSRETAASTGQTKRRGLVLPPRGQALARLQDLEQDIERESPSAFQPDGEPQTDTAFTEVSNAVNAARSNAVNHQGSTAKSNKQLPMGMPQKEMIIDPRSSDAAEPVQIPVQPASVPTAVGLGQHTQARAVREPTTRITVDMPDSMHRKISVLAAETRRSIKDLVLEALATTYFAADQDHS